MLDEMRRAFCIIADDLIGRVEDSETARLIVAAWWRWATDQPGDVQAWVEVLEEQCEVAARMGVEPALIMQQAKAIGIEHRVRLYDAGGLALTESGEQSEVWDA